MSDAPWIPILLALVALLGFLLTFAGIPQTAMEILLADAIFVALVSILVYRVETHLASKGGKTFLRGRPARGLVLAAIAFGATAGILAELASSAGEPRVTPAISIYERQVQEALGPLREASADAFKSQASRSDPDLYAKNARELSEAYHLASGVLAGIEPARRGDQALHSLLRVRVRTVGDAYARLGTAVGGGAGRSEAAAARGRVQGSIEDLREAEETLEDRGYRVSLAS